MEAGATNASPSAFGWQFQVESGIYLMLLSLSKNQCLNIEGYEQDVEILRKNGSYLIAQAKSSKDYFEPFEQADKDGYSHKVKSHLRKGVKGLLASHEALSKKRAKVEEIIYISNFHKPFGHKGSRCWNECERRKYDELEPYEQQALKNVLEGVDCAVIDKLWVHSLPFEGCCDFETAHKWVLHYVRKLLRELGLSEVHAERYLEKIHTLCSYSTTDVKFKCHVEDFVWSAVAYGLEFDDSVFPKCFPAFDEIKTVEYIKEKYNSIIQSTTSRFSICNAVMSLFEGKEYNCESQKERVRRFMDEHYGMLDDIIPPNMEEEESVALKKYIMYQIITSRYILNKANSKFLRK